MAFPCSASSMHASLIPFNEETAESPSEMWVLWDLVSAPHLKSLMDKEVLLFS